MASESARRAATRSVVVAAALLVGPQVAAKAVRDALFLSTFDIQTLPAMVGAAAVVSLLATLGFSRMMARVSPFRLLRAALGGSAVLFLIEWGVAQEWPRVTAIGLYLHHAVLSAVLVSGFWSLVNEHFDPHSARKAMGSIGAGASLGGVLGGLVAWRAAGVAGPVTMLAVLAAASVLGLVSVLAVGGPPPRPASRAKELAPRPASGLRSIVGVAYLRNLALLIALCAFVEAIVDYLLGSAAVAAVGPGRPLLSFFALFHTGTGVLALALQAVLARASLTGLGVAGTLAVLPALTLAGSALALAAPRFAAFVLLRGGQAAVRNSFFRASYELLYGPLPNAQKRPAKVIIDVACDRLGTVAGSLAVMAVLFVAPGISARVLLFLVAAGALASLALVPHFRQGYVRALAESLRRGTAPPDPRAMVEPTTLLTLASIHRERPMDLSDTPRRDEVQPHAPTDPLLGAIVRLRSGDPQAIRGVAEARAIPPALVPHLIPLLARDDVFDAVAAALRRGADRATGQLVDALLDPEVATIVRRRIARVLKGVPTQRTAEGLLQGLGDARFDIRYRCAQALSRICAHEPTIAVAQDALFAIAAREARSAGDSPRHLEHVFTLLATAMDREAMGIAQRALRADDQRIRGTALEYLDHVLPAEVKGPLWPHLGSGPLMASGRSRDDLRDTLLQSSRR